MTRGKAYKRHGTWYADAVHKGQVVWSDNSGKGMQPTLFADCLRVVGAFSVIASKGHYPVKTWNQIVEEAGDF